MQPQLLTFSNLNQYNQDILHFSSTRSGGISQGEYASFNLGNFSDEKRENILYNRQLLCDTLNIAPRYLVGAHQVHGIQVKRIDARLPEMTPDERKDILEGFDALICNTPGICITVTTADCVPVLLYDPTTRSTAAIHSGWRSTLGNIAEQTISSMKTNFSTHSDSIIAAIGPCISVQVYEVGAEVRELFRLKGYDVSLYFKPKSDEKYWFDIRRLVKDQLIGCGVKNIEVTGHCTYSEPELFFSARRQGIHSGRMLSGILLNNEF